jgi:hypothetical protein
VRSYGSFQYASHPTQNKQQRMLLGKCKSAEGQQLHTSRMTAGKVKSTKENNLKNFLKFLLQETLSSQSGYSKVLVKFSTVIKNKVSFKLFP